MGTGRGGDEGSIHWLSTQTHSLPITLLSVDVGVDAAGKGAGKIIFNGPVNVPVDVPVDVPVAAADDVPADVPVAVDVDVVVAAAVDVPLSATAAFGSRINNSIPNPRVALAQSYNSLFATSGFSTFLFTIRSAPKLRPLVKASFWWLKT